ncbi:N-acetylglucosamine-6-phosphate deacetylase [Oleisolibacter albus]|uniref:N-acetylglucosamine-6-phosphate deacetylase n=1 Tax=Oleisolibacter albus TaxID=2171757 RepID=UPI000DF16EDE|nr:N-acetylglucosamine-6-phosphate deacetylase [Oleisolibacter albus]
MRQFLTGCRIFTGTDMREDYGVLLEDGDITALVPADEAPAGVTMVPLPEHGLLAPGFLDTQVNGGGGVLFNQTPTLEGVLAIAAAHRRFGTTALLPTFITDSAEGMRRAADAAAEAAARPGSGIAGLHLEGPFISRERRGVHTEAYVRTPTDADLAFLCTLPARFPSGRVLLSLAPEVVADSDIARLAAAGLVVAGAHSAASHARTLQAIAAGLAGFTHLFNAMPPIANREPGITLAAMTDPATACGIIADGVHVHPALLRTALALKPEDRLFLVTDAMPPTGTDATSFELHGRTIYRRDGRLVTADGVLAGADIDMAAAMRNAIGLLGLPLERALRMASLYPARYLGLETRIGRIAPGAQADLVLLDTDLRVRGTWVAGQRVV